MKFSSLLENLKQGLFVVGHIASKNVNLPILNNVLIRARKNGLELVATNLEIGIVHNIRGKVEKEGLFTVNSRMIADYVNLLPNKKVEIEEKNNNLIIVCGNHKTKIRGQSADDFPLIPAVDKKLCYRAGIEDFRQALSQVVFAVSASEARLELSGVFFNFKGQTLTLAATDSYRLAEKEILIKPDQDNGVEHSIIVPARTVQEFIRILSGLSETEAESGGKEIKIYISDNQVLFSVDSVEFISRLIEGQYPDYKQIIPARSQTTVVVDKAELSRAVKASALFAKIGINDINLDFPAGKNQVIVSSASSQTGETVINLEAAVKGEDNGIIVNYHYLADGLNNIAGENVKIEIVDNNTPCILRPEKAKDYLYLIMPIKQ